MNLERKRRRKKERKRKEEERVGKKYVNNTKELQRNTIRMIIKHNNKNYPKY